MGFAVGSWGAADDFFKYIFEIIARSEAAVQCDLRYRIIGVDKLLHGVPNSHGV